LEKLEKRHRYSHLFHRVRMLGLLKSEEYCTLGEAAKSLGYSRRQGQRWFAAYKEGGMEELLTSRVEERGRNELVSEEAFLELEEAMKRGEIATIAQAHEFLVEWGIGYSHPESVGGLLRRRKVKLKGGGPHTRRPTRASKRLSKKVRREDSGAGGRQAREGFGLR
jgi:transposase